MMNDFTPEVRGDMTRDEFKEAANAALVAQFQYLSQQAEDRMLFGSRGVEELLAGAADVEFFDGPDCE